MRLTYELVSTVLGAALYIHKQGKVSVWTEAEKCGGPQLSRFTKYLRPKPYTLQQNIPNLLGMPISIWSGSAILHTWTGWEFRLWNNFGMALIQMPNFSYTMQTYKSSETSNARLFTIFPNEYLSFPHFVLVWKIALQISWLFQEFKTYSAQTLCEFLLLPWSISFLCEF